MVGDDVAERADRIDALLLLVEEFFTSLLHAVDREEIIWLTVWRDGVYQWKRCQKQAGYEQQPASSQPTDEEEDQAELRVKPQDVTVVEQGMQRSKSQQEKQPPQHVLRRNRGWPAAHQGRKAHAEEQAEKRP